MAKNYFGTKLLATALATFALASCQSESTLLEPVAGNYRDVVLKGTVSKGDITRTDLNLSSDQKKLLLTWNLGDKIHVSEQDGKYVGHLLVTGFADEEHTLAKFEGKVRMLDNDGTQTLSFAYLGKGVDYKATQGRAMTSHVYDFVSQANAGVNALAANDLLLADGDVEVKKGEATFTTLSMKRQFAYGRFTLLYNDEPLQFDENTVVTINTDANDIKTGATVEFPKTISPAGESSISLATSKNDFYVTFVPGSSESKIKFNVTINGDIYEGYSNTYLIEKNDFYRKANGLEVAEALPINVRKTDGSDDEHNFALTYNANYGSKDTWTDNQSGVGLSYTFTLGDYSNIFDETNEGYTFVGWTLNADGSGDVLVPNATLSVVYPDGNATVYAKWEETEYTWNVTWKDGYTENPLKTETYKGTNNYDISGKYPADPTREGYKFTGWAPQVSKLTKDQLEVEIVAQWKKNVVDYKLTYHQNLNSSTLTIDDTPDPATTADSYDFDVAEYDALGPVWTSTHGGYVFTGWNTKADGTGTTYAPGSKFNRTVDQPTGNLYAQWKKEASGGVIVAPGAGGSDY